jgi:chemotaxis signal transduction protein
MGTSANDSDNGIHPQVVVFPAGTPLVGGRQLGFLFSVRQVVDVLKQVDIQPHPFDRRYAQGVTEWRGRVIPVLCLEHCLGLQTMKNGMPMRNIVVRGVQLNDSDEAQDLYAVCQVGTAARQYRLPLACRPVTPPEELPGLKFLRGLYATDENLFLVLDLEKLLDAIYTVSHKEAARGL